MARIDNAYAYYISTYAQKTVSRYDSHKKSELRKVYNKIVKINKDSPLYNSESHRCEKICHRHQGKRALHSERCGISFRPVRFI